MKKQFLFMACLMASTLWAVEPADVVRAYDHANGGYVLVDASGEVLAFSKDGSVADDLESLQAVLEAEGLTLEVMPQRAANADGDGYEMPELAADSVGPLLKDIAFSQSAPYNLMTPLDSKNNYRRCVTGCVATAMAEIMTYWRWPEKCNPTVVTYHAAHLDQDLTIDYDTMAFDWDNILPYYANGASGTKQQQMAVSRLMWACGVAAHMNYTSGSSGTQSNLVPDAFVKQFNYARGVSFDSRGDYTENAFNEMLIEELDAARPMYASGQYTGTEQGFDGGHAFVIDGYAYLVKDVNKTKPYFHFNWGWNGTDQKGRRYLWYRLSSGKDLAPYISGLQVIRGLQPNRATPVEETEMQTIDNGKIYDILGREVSETKSGQLYIRNGKKYIAK